MQSLFKVLVNLKGRVVRFRMHYLIYDFLAVLKKSEARSEDIHIYNVECLESSAMEKDILFGNRQNGDNFEISTNNCTATIYSSKLVFQSLFQFILKKNLFDEIHLDPCVPPKSQGSKNFFFTSLQFSPLGNYALW